MKKLLLLLAVLSLNACTLLPSDTLIRLISGKTGVFTLDDTSYGFTISSNAEKYVEPDGTTLHYVSGSDDSAVYEGDVIIILKFEARVELSRLTTQGGMYSMYLDDSLIINTVFVWADATSVYSTDSSSSFIIKSIEDK